MPLLESDKYAEEQVMPDIIKKAEKECKNEVPGTKYNNFSVDTLETKFTITAVFCPVYIITYEYEGKEYLVYMSGSIKDSAYCDTKPEDSDLAAKKAMLDNELDEKKSIRLKSGVIGFAVIPIIVILSLIILGDIAVIIFVIAVIFEIFYVKKNFLPKHKEVKSCESKINVYLGNLDDKRKKVAEIVKQDNLSVEEQKTKIQEIVEL